MRFRETNPFPRMRTLAVCCVATVVSVAPAFAAEAILQDKTLLVAFDTKSGALTRLEDKSTHWIVERRAELGTSFRLHVPLPNRRYNFVLGEKQELADFRRPSDNTLVLEWKNLLSDHGGVLPMTFQHSSLRSGLR